MTWRATDSLSRIAAPVHAKYHRPVMHSVSRRTRAEVDMRAGVTGCGDGSDPAGASHVVRRVGR